MVSMAYGVPGLRIVIMLAVLAGLAGSSGAVARPSAQVPPQVTPRPVAPPMLLTDPVPDPKQQGVQWFAPTGHTLRGIFLEYWNRYGGLYQFGYPITEEFFEPVGSDNRLLRVQYFERNRFEFHPEYANTQYEVLLGSLGRDFRTQDPRTDPRTEAGNAYFGETGHNLYGPFRLYWETHGGAFVHGFPMTESYMERNAIDGKMYLVQYFERSRFELHPEYKGTRYEILLGLLGRQLSAKKGFPFGWYPTYGHAPDFSWVAGKLEMHFSGAVSGPYAGCSILTYQQGSREARLQLSGGPWRAIADAGRQFQILVGDFLVVFGQRAGPGQEFVPCLPNPAPGYIVERAQHNPAD